jgi:hypothetical protein
MYYYATTNITSKEGESREGLTPPLPKSFGHSQLKIVNQGLDNLPLDLDLLK